MDEQEWLTCEHPAAMLRLVATDTFPTSLQCRLFVRACCGPGDNSWLKWTYSSELIDVSPLSGARYWAGDKVGQWHALSLSQEVKKRRAHFLRDILGNIFRPLWPDLVGYTTPTVASLARVAHEDPLGPLAVADALEEAGLTGAVLTHLREGGPHVEGCHVLELLKGER